MARQSLFAAFGMQQLPPAHKSLSAWHLQQCIHTNRICNSKQAFQFMASEEITGQGFCAIFLDKDNYVINHRYFLEDFNSYDLVVLAAVTYKAHSLYFFHLEDKTEEHIDGVRSCYMPATNLNMFVIRIQCKLELEGIQVKDIICMCRTAHFSYRRQRWLLSQKDQDRT